MTSAKLFTKKQMETNEKKFLATYAVLSDRSLGREFTEKEDENRTVFQRDRDRIIHSKAFRRLSGKTQVFVATYGDHFRDRLSHTLEVAQIARDISRNLRLNEDLCEAIALAHDLGHTPFGHAGESALNEIMRQFGRNFEHNEQSRRIVENLEKQFSDFDGLNLTFEVRQGLAKHQTIYDQRGKLIVGKTLEAQVADIADEIAYHSHDLDDGLRSELFTLAQVKKVGLIFEILSEINAKRDSAVLRPRIVSGLISMMISDVLFASIKNLKKYKIRSLEDVLGCGRQIVDFSPVFKKKVVRLRRFLWDKMYNSPRVKAHSFRGKRILEKLFWRLYKNPKLLPKRFYEKMDAPDALEIIVKDFVAGCTDVYAEQCLKKH